MVASLEMPLAAVVDSVGDFVTLALLRCNFWQEYFHQNNYTQISKYRILIFTAMPCLSQLSLQKCIYVHYMILKKSRTHTTRTQIYRYIYTYVSVYVYVNINIIYIYCMYV